MGLRAVSNEESDTAAPPEGTERKPELSGENFSIQHVPQKYIVSEETAR